MANYIIINDITEIDSAEHCVSTAFISLVYSLIAFDKENFTKEMTLEELGLTEEDTLIILERMSQIYGSHTEELTCINYNNLNLKISEIIEEIDRILS